MVSIRGSGKRSLCILFSHHDGVFFGGGVSAMSKKERLNIISSYSKNGNNKLA